jgi:hypothetical protein
VPLAIADRLIAVLSVLPKGTGGFVINGENVNDISGFSTSSAGDINGDGLDDLIVGARNAGLNDKKEIGKSYIIFGKIDSTAINLSAIASGTGGFVINGENAMDYSGWSVSTSRYVDCCAVNFTEDDIGFTYLFFIV